MSYRVYLGSRRMLPFSCCFLVCSLLLASREVSTLAADPADGDLLNRQLATGEFAPAVAAADQLNGANRDDAFSRIAKAQSGAGLFQQAISSASRIQGDESRSSTLNDIGSRQGGMGGGVQPDFDALIELITTTVQPTSWDEAGGPGSVKEFAGGIHVDASGLMRRVLREESKNRLAELRDLAAPKKSLSLARKTSPLRKVSLSRLEREIQLRQAAGQRPSQEMKYLAGLQRIEYVMLYPETGDVVIAGPAGDWTQTPEGRVVGVESGRPTLQLDDLLVVFRHVLSNKNSYFGCSIDPTQDGLANAQSFLKETTSKPIPAGKRSQWSKDLADRLGPQNLSVKGIDPRTHVASILLEADYRMKLVGLGLEEGTKDVPSYFEILARDLPAGKTPPAMGVLRWWFTMDYDSVMTSKEHDVFQLRGQGLKVLSENEALTERGERVHTGQSDLYTSQFAENFTKHFSALAVKYPIYAELQSIFDLAIAATIVKHESLADRANWHMLAFMDDQRLPVARGNAPTTVNSVVNHTVIKKGSLQHFVAAVSGGVAASPEEQLSAKPISEDTSGALGSRYDVSKPDAKSRDPWWWD